MVSPPFEAIVGQPQAVELLTQAVQQRRIAPAYLFAGSAGIGRSRTALAFLRLLLAKSGTADPFATCTDPILQKRIRDRNHPDLLWVEPTYLHQGRRVSVSEAAELGVKRKAPPQIRLEQIREISQFLSRPPLEAARAVVVIEQAETMREAAANALLKTLEEPGQATLILLAPDTDALLPTLVSRCQKIPFYRLSQAEMATVLQQAEHAEILNYPNILAIAQGSPGAAIASWQYLEAVPAELLQALQTPPQTLKQALTLARQVDQTLDAEAQLWLIEYLQHHYWRSPAPDRVYQPRAIVPCLDALEKARRYLLQYVQPRLVWEVTLIQIQQSMT
ncbi:MAG: DNA polymerase III subunit delta' [Thainema sp.]